MEKTGIFDLILGNGLYGFIALFANSIIVFVHKFEYIFDFFLQKTLEEVEEDLNRFFPNMLPDLSAFLMDQGIDAFYKEK